MFIVKTNIHVWKTNKKTLIVIMIKLTHLLACTKVVCTYNNSLLCFYVTSSKYVKDFPLVIICYSFTFHGVRFFKHWFQALLSITKSWQDLNVWPVHTTYDISFWFHDWELRIGLICLQPATLKLIKSQWQPLWHFSTALRHSKMNSPSCKAMVILMNL